MLEGLLALSIILLFISITGYVLVVIREKYYLRNNIIFIDHKDLEPEHIRDIDIKHFMLGSTEIMAGDEVKILLENSARIRGTVLGGNKSENSIAILTDHHGVRNFKINKIRKLKVISRYGKFFKNF